MAKLWYVVQVYSNFEDKVEAMLRENIERAGKAAAGKPATALPSLENRKCVSC